MPNVNFCVLAGHLGKDPEVKFTSGGTGKMTFSLAVNRRVKKGDQWENETDWFNVIHWKPADFLTNALHKGSACLVKGSIQIRPYETNDGQKRTAVEIVAEKIELLGGREQSEDRPVSAPRSSRQAQPAPAADNLDGMGVDFSDVPF